MTYQDFFESSLSRVYTQYTQHDSGTITAYRGERTKAENEQFNKELKKKLIALGYSVTKIKGSYEEKTPDGKTKLVKEESFLVIDYKDKKTLKTDLIFLGNKYDQEAITFSDPKGKYVLIGTSKKEDADPAFRQEYTLGSPMFGTSGEIHSKVNGRPFIFKSIEESSIKSIDQIYPLITRQMYLNERDSLLKEIQEFNSL